MGGSHNDDKKMEAKNKRRKLRFKKIRRPALSYNTRETKWRKRKYSNTVESGGLSQGKAQAPLLFKKKSLEGTETEKRFGDGGKECSKITKSLYNHQSVNERPSEEEESKKSSLRMRCMC